MNTNTQTVDCPTCKKSVEWTQANSYRPFCSKRCKLIDFGDWASERISIPGEPIYPVVEDEYEQ
ncbi:MAG: DNA gyrase inhibitor YacG [Pseudohongiellaceae bacterium]